MITKTYIFFICKYKADLTNCFIDIFCHENHLAKL